MKWLVRYLSCSDMRNFLPYTEETFDNEGDARRLYNKLRASYAIFDAQLHEVKSG